MEWLRELQQILGDRIRLEIGSDSFKRTGPFFYGTEEWIPVGNGQYAVVDRERLSPETIELTHLLIQKGASSSPQSKDHWFQLLIRNQWDAGWIVNEAIGQRWEIQLPSMVAVLEMRGKDTDGALTLLEEILSDRVGHTLVEGQDGRIWLYLPLQAEEKIDHVKETGARLLDTLLTELYIAGKLAISRPVLNLQDMPHAKQEAEIALLAGTAFGGGQKIYLYGQMGLAQLLYGVSAEAKTAFLEEVLPKGKDKALTQEFRETIHSFAQHGQNIAETARALFIHRNTLLYRLDKIQEVTGKDIRQFEDLMVLWLALVLRNEQSAQ